MDSTRSKPSAKTELGSPPPPPQKKKMMFAPATKRPSPMKIKSVVDQPSVSAPIPTKQDEDDNEVRAAPHSEFPGSDLEGDAADLEWLSFCHGIDRELLQFQRRHAYLSSFHCSPAQHPRRSLSATLSVSLPLSPKSPESSSASRPSSTVTIPFLFSLADPHLWALGHSPSAVLVAVQGVPYRPSSLPAALSGGPEAFVRACGAQGAPLHPLLDCSSGRFHAGVFQKGVWNQQIRISEVLRCMHEDLQSLSHPSSSSAVPSSVWQLLSDPSMRAQHLSEVVASLCAVSSGPFSPSSSSSSTLDSPPSPKLGQPPSQPTFFIPTGVHSSSAPVVGDRSSDSHSRRATHSGGGSDDYESHSEGEFFSDNDAESDDDQSAAAAAAAPSSFRSSSSSSSPNTVQTMMESSKVKFSPSKPISTAKLIEAASSSFSELPSPDLEEFVELEVDSRISSPSKRRKASHKHEMMESTPSSSSSASSQSRKMFSFFRKGKKNNQAIFLTGSAEVTPVLSGHSSPPTSVASYDSYTFSSSSLSQPLSQAPADASFQPMSLGDAGDAGDAGPASFDGVGRGGLPLQPPPPPLDAAEPPPPPPPPSPSSSPRFGGGSPSAAPAPSSSSSSSPPPPGSISLSSSPLLSTAPMRPSGIASLSDGKDKVLRSKLSGISQVTSQGKKRGKMGDKEDRETSQKQIPSRITEDSKLTEPHQHQQQPAPLDNMVSLQDRFPSIRVKNEEEHPQPTEDDEAAKPVEGIKLEPISDDILKLPDDAEDDEPVIAGARPLRQKAASGFSFNCFACQRTKTMSTRHPRPKPYPSPPSPLPQSPVVDPSDPSPATAAQVQREPNPALASRDQMRSAIGFAIKPLRGLMHPAVSKNLDDRQLIVNEVERMLQSKMKDSYSDWLRAKLLIVGRENVGKTTLLRSMKNRRSSGMTLSTDGIAVHSLYLSTPAAKMILYCWDFAGQDIYYPSHSFFLTNERSLYAIVFDLSVEGDDARVPFWLSQIDAAGARAAPILIVGTHVDKCLKDLERVERIFVALSTRYQALYNLMGFYAVDAVSGEGVKPLKSKLCELIQAAPRVSEKLPENAYKLEKTLLHLRKKKIAMGVPPILSLRSLQDLASKLGSQKLDVSLRTWHQLGICLYYGSFGRELPGKTKQQKAQVFLKALVDRLPELQELVILDAQWLIDLMACVISFKTNIANMQGCLPEPVLRQLLAPLVQHQPEGAETLCTTLIGLLESFELLIPQSDDSPDAASRRFLVPALLPFGQPEEYSGWLEGRDMSHHCSRVFSLKVLPLGLFPRLLVRVLKASIAPMFRWREGVVVQCGTSVGSVVIRHSSQQSPFVSLVVRAFGGTQKDVVSLFRLLDGTVQNLLLFYGGAAIATTVLCPFCLLPSHPSASFEFAFLVLNASQLSCPRCAAPIPLQAGIPDLLVSDHAHLQLSLEQVELGEEIAKGGFGTVFKGTYQKQQVAVKMLNLVPGDQPKPSSAKDPLFHMQSEQFAELSHEAFIMAQCDHPNIVKLFGFHFSASNSFLVMELMSAGTLFNLLHTMPSTNPLLAVVMAVEVAKGMYHLHSQEPPIVHGDLKSPNILISSRSHPLLQYPIAYWRLCFHFTSKPDDDPDRLQAVHQFAMEASLPVADGRAIRGQWAQLVALLQPADSHTPIAKIADFGASESVFVDELTRDAIVENPIWLAPEQIDSVWSDVWSFGIVMYEVASLSLPYSQMTFKFSFELSDAIKRGLRPDLSSLPPDLPQAYLDLMTSCWALNPSDRPTFDAILLALTSISIQTLLLI